MNTLKESKSFDLKKNQKQHAKSFLDLFTNEIQNNVKSFCKLLFDHESDVFIFMARKAACMFNSLKELGLTDVTGIILNDRILDMDLRFIEGKRVTLVDDCIFTGTTLFRAANKVRQAKCKTFDTLSLAVNTDTIRHELLPGHIEWEDLRISKPLYANNNANCVQQCYDIVKAISVLPHPYDVDFPQSRSIKLKKNTLDRLLHLNGWVPYDITTALQKDNNVMNVTLLPMQGVLDNFCEWSGKTNISFTTIKIRLYIKRQSVSTYSVRFVPIVVLSALKNVDIIEALTQSSSEPETCINNMGLISSEARYRFFQYIIAHNFLNFFIISNKQMFPEDYSIEMRSDLFEMSYGKGSWDYYNQLWRYRANITLPNIDAYAYECTVKKFDQSRINVYNSSDLTYQFSYPFTWLYKEKELPTQAFVRKNGLRKEHENADRLTDGFTAHFLFDRISSPVFDKRSSLSILLDQMIDQGIIVPTIVEHDDHCIRVYRHGEDAILNEATEGLLLQAIKAYLDSCNKESIRSFELSKIIVLFLQIGIRRSLVEQLTALTELPHNCMILSTKGHLHGLVPTVTTPKNESGEIDPPYVPGNSHPTFLIDRWVMSGYLKMSSDNQGRFFEFHQFPVLRMGVAKEAEFRQIGRSIGSAVSKRIVNTDKDLTLLSTCSESDHVLRALSGEIAIFRLNWYNLSKTIREYAKNKKFAHAHIELHRKYDVYTAINSGSMKYKWYLADAFTKLVDKVTETFINDSNSSLADAWIPLWPQGNLMYKENSTAISDVLTKTGRSLLAMNIQIRLMDYWLVLEGSILNQFSEKDLSETITGIKDEIYQIRKLHSNITRKTPFVNLINAVMNRIDDRNRTDAYNWCQSAANDLDLYARKYSKIQLEDIDIAVNAWGNIDILERYPYAFYIDIDYSTTPHSRRLLDSIVWKLNANVYVNDNYVYMLPAQRNPWRVGTWVLFGGNQNSLEPARFCCQVVNELSKFQIRFRAVLIGQLSSDDCIAKYSCSVIDRDGNFFERIDSIKIHILSDSINNSIGFANEYRQGKLDEIDKFLSLYNLQVKPQKSIVVSENELITPKKFTVSNFIFGQLPASDNLDTGHNPTDKSSNKRYKILLCTATDIEDIALDSELRERSIKIVAVTKQRGVYRSLGFIGRHEVYWVRSGQGVGRTRGSLAVVTDACEDIDFDIAIGLGIAFGVVKQEHKIGTILISDYIIPYEPAKLKPNEVIDRTDMPPADPKLLQAIDLYKLQCKNMSFSSGGLLCGEKKIDDPQFRMMLEKRYGNAIGGDMESYGIAAACIRRGKRWVILKAISDWASPASESKDQDQKEAALASSRFVLGLIESGLIP